MRAKRLFVQVHKWVGLIAAIQVALWMASGLVMSWFPIGEVRGEHNIRAPADEVVAAIDLVPLDAATRGAALKEALLKSVAGRPVWQIAFADGASALIDARDGTRLDPIGEDFARAIAQADFAGEGSIAEIALTSNPGIEYRAALPVWRIVFDDAEKTHLYVSPQTGRVVARRNAVWRLYDFFWMLHIMDYEAREDFNHPAIIGFGALGLFLALSGAGLLWWSVLRPLVRRRKQGAEGDGLG